MNKIAVQVSPVDLPRRDRVYCGMRSVSMMASGWIVGALPWLSLAAVSPATPAAVAQGAAAPGCTPKAQATRCDLTAFQRRLAVTQYVAVEAQPMDRMAVAQLRRLVLSLGKQTGNTDHPATLMLYVSAVQPTGVSYGPGDHDLATLRAYALEPDGRHGAMLWAETLRGGGDRSWPVQVHDLIAQFQSRLQNAGR